MSVNLQKLISTAKKFIKDDKVDIIVKRCSDHKDFYFGSSAEDEPIYVVKVISEPARNILKNMEKKLYEDCVEC